MKKEDDSDYIHAGGSKQQRLQAQKEFWKKQGLTYVSSDDEETATDQQLRYQYFAKDYTKHEPALVSRLDDIVSNKIKINKGEKGYTKSLFLHMFIVSLSCCSV